MKNQNAVSRDADKFVVRMPETMRERIFEIAKKLHTSMNSAIVQGLEAWLDKFEELTTLLEGVRLLRQSLEVEKKELATERKELADLKAKLETQLGGNKNS